MFMIINIFNDADAQLILRLFQLFLSLFHDFSNSLPISCQVCGFIVDDILVYSENVEDNVR